MASTVLSGVAASRFCLPSYGWYLMQSHHTFCEVKHTPAILGEDAFSLRCTPNLLVFCLVHGAVVTPRNIQKGAPE